MDSNNYINDILDNGNEMMPSHNEVAIDLGCSCHISSNDILNYSEEVPAYCGEDCEIAVESGCSCHISSNDILNYSEEVPAYCGEDCEVAVEFNGCSNCQFYSCQTLG